MTRSNQLGGKTAIVGIGATEFSKASGRSEMSLACEAVVAALDDAGIAPTEVDGFACFGAETNPEIEIARHRSRRPADHLECPSALAYHVLRSLGLGDLDDDTDHALGAIVAGSRRS